MEKIILLIFSMILWVAQSRGQGEVVFGNSSTAKIWTNYLASTTTGAGAVMPVNASQSYTFALFAYYDGNVTTSTNSGAFVTADGGPENFQFDNPEPGYFPGSSWELVAYGVNGNAGRITDANSFETVNGLPSGVYATMEMIGWNTAVGGSTVASFLAALDSVGSNDNSIGLMYGYSSEGSILLGNGTVPPNTSVVGTGNGNIGAFTIGEIQVVPEPGTLALAGLGGLLCCLFPRKK